MTRFTTRDLVVLAILGAASGVIVHIARPLGLILQAGVPWLAFPAPLPFFLGPLVAAALIPRTGSALISSLVGAVVGFGGLLAIGGVVIELVVWLARRRVGFTMLVVAGALTGAVTSGFMYLYQEFLDLSVTVKVLALVLRLVLGAVYGAAAWWIAGALLRTGAVRRPAREPRG